MNFRAMLWLRAPIAGPAKILYVYNIATVLTKNKPVNKIRKKVWALPDESSLPVHTGP